jgi:hypothetical protein
MIRDHSDCFCEICTNTQLQAQAYSYQDIKTPINVIPATSELEALMLNVPPLKVIFTETTQTNFEGMSVLAKSIEDSWKTKPYSILVWCGKKPSAKDACQATFGLMAQRLPDVVNCEEVGDSFNINLTPKISQADWEHVIDQLFEYWIARNTAINQKEFMLEVLQ